MTSLMDKFRSRAVGLLLELVTVVLGVFIALAADAWRQGLVDRGRESAYLASLEADLSETLSELRRSIELDESRLAEVSAFVDWLRSDQPPPSPDYRSPGMGPAPLYISSATLRIGADDVGLVRDLALRNEIARALSVVEKFAERIMMIDEAGLELFLHRYDVEAEIRLSTPDAPITAFREKPLWLAGYRGYENIVQNRIEMMKGVEEALERLRRVVLEPAGSSGGER